MKSFNRNSSESDLFWKKKMAKYLANLKVHSYIQVPAMCV